MVIASQEQFNDFAQGLREPGWFLDHRKAALARMLAAQIPDFRQGLLSGISFPEKFELSDITPENGRHDSTVAIEYDKSSGVSIFSSSEVSQAMPAESAALFKAFLTEDWMHDADALAWHQQAFANDALFIRIPKDCAVSKPILITYSCGAKPLLASIFVLAEKGSSAKLIMIKKSAVQKVKKSGEGGRKINEGDDHNYSGNQSYVSEDLRVFAVGDNEIEVTAVQALDDSSVIVQRRTSWQGKQAAVKWDDVCIGGAFCRSEVISILAEKGSSTKSVSSFIVGERKRFMLSNSALHKSQFTVSSLLTRGALAQESKVFSKGLIRIDPEASGSEGFQKQDSLLLGKDAEAAAIPNLEIMNDDVKCGHGVSISDIDDGRMAYLMSRGLDERAAAQLIVEGFLLPAIELITDISLRSLLFSAVRAAVARTGRG